MPQKSKDRRRLVFGPVRCFVLPLCALTFTQLHPQPQPLLPQPLLPQPQPVLLHPHPLQLLKRRIAAMMMSQVVESSKRLQRQFILKSSYFLEFGILIVPRGRRSFVYPSLYHTMRRSLKCYAFLGQLEVIGHKKIVCHCGV